MKRYIALLLFTGMLCGCASTAPISNPSVTTETVATSAFDESTAMKETVSVTTETVCQTQPTTEVTVPAATGFDPVGIIQNMTLEEKVGQLFLARCPDTDAIEQLQKYHLGGYILFGSDTTGQTKESLKAKIESYQEASRLPMLIAVDEEGGTVCRISNVSTLRKSKFPSPRDLYNKGGMELLLSTEEEKCLLLQDLGINVNMAPVCDITTDPAAFMYKRSLGQSPEITGVFASSVCSVMAQNGIGSVLKHFPGYGNNVDTHTGIAKDNRSLEELESYDLISFAMAIENGCDAILVSHTVVKCLDPEYPASISPAVHRYLRNEMVFGGVVVTDDLVMQAITKLYGDGEAAVLAVLAGNDLLCVTNYATQYEAVLAAVENGRIPIEQVDISVERILRWKYRLGLFGEDFFSDLT